MDQFLELKLSLPEILSFLGLVQCVVTLVYMIARAGNRLKASWAILYFVVLSLGFYADLSETYFKQFAEYFETYQWMIWYSVPILSIILIEQIAKIDRLPRRRTFLFLLMIPAIITTSLAFGYDNATCTSYISCPESLELAKILTIIFTSLIMLYVWTMTNIQKIDSNRDSRSASGERFWLIIAIQLLNTVLIGLLLLDLMGFLPEQQIKMIKTIVGIAAVYLASTSLFRIFPQAIQIIDTKESNATLTDSEISYIPIIDTLLTKDKVYQEASYGRSQLAQELSLSESQISRIVSTHYQTTLPQLLNKHRINEAKHLLADTNENIQVIASETGFNAISSFNRVFKEVTGMSPSEYRKEHDS